MCNSLTICKFTNSFDEQGFWNVEYAVFSLFAHWHKTELTRNRVANDTAEKKAPLETEVLHLYYMYTY